MQRKTKEELGTNMHLIHENPEGKNMKSIDGAASDEGEDIFKGRIF